MKRLMLGNEAVARGLYEAGCRVVSSYPGTPSTEITEAAAKYDELYCEWAPNEKVAMEAAFGASLAGARSFCAMKQVGLNVAADPLFTISYTGVNAGLVVAVADDPGMHSSQNEQDSRHYAVAAKLPMLEPADSTEALRFTKLAFELSERFDTPVMLRMCTRISHSQSLAETSDREERDLVPYEKRIAKYVMMPGFARARHPVIEQRTRDLLAFAEETELNRVEAGESRALGIITSGTCYQYVREALGEGVGVLKLGLVNPLPERLLRDFVAGYDRVVVVEELDGVIETHCRALGLCVEGKALFPPEGELSQNLVAKALGSGANESPALAEPMPPRPPVMCSGCPHRSVFYLLGQNKIRVMGDIGCYTLGALAPLSAMDSTICMGASVSGLHGFCKADPEAERNTVGVLGDSTFMHSGMTGLANMVYNGSNGTVLILDNSITGMTGHQHNPTTGYNIKGDPAAQVDLEALCRAMGVQNLRVADPYDLADTEKAIKESLAEDGVSVVIVRRPCALLKSVKMKPPIFADSTKCVGCRACMKLGCPSISIVSKKAVIDKTLCTGCGVCANLCRFGALREEAAQ